MNAGLLLWAALTHLKASIPQRPKIQVASGSELVDWNTGLLTLSYSAWERAEPRAY